VSGSGFQSRGTVTFEVAVGSGSAVLGECRWNMEDGSTNYTSNAVRYDLVATELGLMLVHVRQPCACGSMFAGALRPLEWAALSSCESL
jgi:hypothetical protein